MSYKVIRRFQDLQDNRHTYDTGDIFPRKGVEVSEERIQQLLTGDNKRGISFIEEVHEEPSSLPKKDTEKVKTDESPSKKTRAKKSTKKTQE